MIGNRVLLMFPDVLPRRPDATSEARLPDPIRLLLVDDQILSRGLLRSGLERERDLKIVAELNRSDDVVGAAKRHRANVALLDAAGPGNDSITVTTKLRTSMPECRVVINNNNLPWNRRHQMNSL